MLSRSYFLQEASTQYDGGCLMAFPSLSQDVCDCQANPTASKFAACNSLNQPVYFDDASDIPNGVCIQFANGESTGTSLDKCSADADCLSGANLTCQDGQCVDQDGKKESSRLVQTCVSPKRTSTDTQMAGCPFGGPGQAGNILSCHKWWIGDEGMTWKKYLQFNPLGEGDAYAWAYDEAVCSVRDNQIDQNPDYPWCVDKDQAKSAVDLDGNVTDNTCPCTSFNPNSVLNAVPFSDLGYGKHMFVHVYDLMTSNYVQPTTKADFKPVEIANVPSEDDEFYLKVVNQYDEDILVYMDAPPSRYQEAVTGDFQPGLSAKWGSWTGPTKTMRGETQPGQPRDDADAWVSRVTIAPNDDPSNVSQPTMRVSGAKGTPQGGFYVPKGYHLRVKVATQEKGGWFQTRSDCPTTACSDAGVSLWFTAADAYTYPDRDPLLLVEPNVNAFPKDDPEGFSKGTIWFDLSAVDGINANIELIYDKIDRRITVPLFQSKTLEPTKKNDTHETFLF